MYPLRFTPIYRQYIWGGRRLKSILGKQLGSGDDYAESWEIVDHGEDQSVVRDGALQGLTLSQLARKYGGEIFGPGQPRDVFPLLFKFLDAHRNLSVQVHPDDARAARLDPPDLGKTEAWVILHAEPGSLVYAGLKRGFDRAALEREVERGTTELCLHRFEPRAGDCIFIPAGTIHALGAGLVVAEIQQASDTTFRLFDWNRVGADGQPRQLHIQQALDAIDFDGGPVDPQKPVPTDRDFVHRLVACDKFVLDRWTLNDVPQTLSMNGRFHILAVIEGTIVVDGDASDQPLSTGHTMLVPAACDAPRIHSDGNCILLDMYLP